jgi:uncharacterized membrane protein YgcG
MRFRKATPAEPRLPRPARLPRVRPPKLHQPAAHVTAMVAAAAVVSVFAAATPTLQGSFVGGNTVGEPAGAITSQGPGTAGTSSAGSAVLPGTPTFTTTVTPPPNAIVGTGAGNIATVQFTGPTSSSDLASPLAGDGIPVTALEAYQNAANTADATDPNCGIPWPLLAGIGRVESDHGRYGGAVLRPDGTSTRPIIGIPLNGNGTEVVTDTDGGSIDGDPVYDHAVGPMQFIPSTWARYGADGNGDGIKDPFNIFDAALAAANYLCVAGGNLATTAGQTRAVLTYNHSTAYLDEVLALEHAYASGEPGLIIPAAPVVVPPVPVQHPGGRPVPPPADPGPPLGLPSGRSHHRTHHHGPSSHPTSTPAAPHGGAGSSTSAGPGGSTSSSSSDAPSTATSTVPDTGTGSGTSSDPGDPSSSAAAPSCPASSSGSTSGSSTGSSTDSSGNSAGNGAGVAATPDQLSLGDSATPPADTAKPADTSGSNSTDSTATSGSAGPGCG